LRFFIFPLVTMLSFIAVGIAAIWFRADPRAFKRLMMVATALILVAAFNRWWGDAIYEALGDAYFGTLVRNAIGPDLMIAGLAGYDLVTRGRIHPAIMIAAPLIVIGQLAATALYHSEWWPGIAWALVGL
jgi:hypothetical protein